MAEPNKTGPQSPAPQAATPQRAKTILVDWRQPRLLRHVESPKPAPKSVDGLELPPEGRTGFTLKPGINSVDADAFEKACKTLLFKHYLADENLVVIETKEGKAVAADELAKLNEKEAVRVIKATNTEDLLEAWEKTETRAGVTAAITEQLDAIEAAAAPVEKPKKSRR